MTAPAEDAVGFHSTIATDFGASYGTDPNRRERVEFWNGFLDRYTRGVNFAYDMGCGPGVLSAEIAARGIEVMAIDGSSGMLEVARRTIADRGLTNVAFEERRLPIDAPETLRPAELIISSSVLEYLDSITEALKGFKTILKPGGVVIFSISNRDSLSRLLARSVHRLTGRPKYLGFLKHFMTIAGLRGVVEAAGLQFVEADYFGRADPLNRNLARFFPPRLSSNMIIVVARKA